MASTSNSTIKDIIHETVLKMLEDSMSDGNIEELKNKHSEKVHFIPIHYRIIGGILQGLNIKFGNFIETLLIKILKTDPSVEVLKEAGQKITLYFTPQTDSLIDTYITARQRPDSPDDCSSLFLELLKNILKIENHATDAQRQGIKKDVDGFFKTDKLLVYTELKYNDDHDSGKFVDLNRKFLKTWAGLAVLYKIKQAEELLPIIYYFNSKKRYGPIYTPGSNIMRGSQFFDRFLKIKYDDVDQYLSDIGEDADILKIFDDMYNSVRNPTT